MIYLVFFLYGFFQGGVGRTTDAKKCTTKKDIDGREREAEIERERVRVGCAHHYKLECFLQHTLGGGGKKTAPPY